MKSRPSVSLPSPRSILGTVAASAIALASPGGAAHARPPEGGYFGFGLGYAAASGDRGVQLKGQLPVPESFQDEMVRTDFGSGMSFELRFGWLVGPIAPEISIFGHGEFGFEDGAGYPSFQVRFHPMMLVDSMADVPVDANVYIGAGYVIGGYQPSNDDDGKGWNGWNLSLGVAGSYQLSERVFLGLDLKFALPQYGEWMFDWDDDINFEPTATPSTLIIAPSLQIQAYF